MKLKMIFATAYVAMFTLVSCSKNDPVSTKGTEEVQSFFIQIGKTTQMSRAEGADMSGQKVEFTDGYLIFASGDNIGRVIKIVANTPGTDEVTVEKLEQGTTIEDIPANTKGVYLYGNLGNSISTIGSVAVVDGKLSDVENLTWVLADIQNDANDVAKVPVYGKGDVKSGTVYPERLESEFEVKPIGCRLQIGQISCSDSRVEELQLAGIFINNFYHSMDAGFALKDNYLVNHGIDITKYSASGYTNYLNMKDIITPTDLNDGPATPATPGNSWAYNFMPAPMPHIVLHFANLKVNGKEPVTNQYATVAKYSTLDENNISSEYTTAERGYVYKLNVDISDYEKQIADLPESGSTVMGYVDIEIIDWQSKIIYPEW